MGKVRVSTFSLSSRNMWDLRRQMDDLLQRISSGKASYQSGVTTYIVGKDTYQIGEYYEPAPGYVAVDVSHSLPAELVQFHTAMDNFESDSDEENQTH